MLDTDVVAFFVQCATTGTYDTHTNEHVYETGQYIGKMRLQKMKKIKITFGINFLGKKMIVTGLVFSNMFVSILVYLFVDWKKKYSYRP